MQTHDAVTRGRPWRFGLAGLACLAVALSIVPPRAADSAPRGDALRPFSSTWTQRIAGEDGWTERGSVTETLEAVRAGGRKAWLRTQVVHQGPVSFFNRSWIDRKTLLPIRFERELGPDVPEEMMPRLAQAGFVPGFRVEFDGTTYRTTVVDEAGKEKSSDAGSFDDPPYDGSVLGLVIAALPLAPDYTARLPVAFIAPNDGSMTRYIVEASVVGREPVSVGGTRTAEAWRVDVAWVDPASGEVTSAPGPEAAGGAYWVLADPAKGLPHVPKYRNERVDFELTAGD